MGLFWGPPGLRGLSYPPTKACRGFSLPPTTFLSCHSWDPAHFRRLLGLVQTFFSPSEPSAYTNEKVLLLTKMDLTEFRSYTLKGIGLGGLPPGRRGVGDCVRWPSTFRPWHLACSHALEGSLTSIITSCTATSQQTPNPKP